ncbi:MAG: fibronectin-binding domain-containing protein, partial [Nitrososphaeria archaeon]
ASAPSGEYLPRGSFMIRGPRNYVRGLRLEVAVGLCSEPDGGASPCSGPRRSVDERGLVYILLEPGHLRASDVASKAVRIISDHLPQGLEGLRGGLRVDDFLRLLPPGGSRIVGIARGKRLREVRVG